MIDGSQYQVNVEELTRTADFLDKCAERTESGELHRELIGVYINYKLKLYCTDPQEYERLWQKLTEPVEFHMVTVPDGAGDYTFEAYFSGVGDRLLRQYGPRSYWTDLTVNFTAKRPARA